MSATAPFFAGMFTKDEATAAQRTFCFVAVDATDGVTEETGLTYAGADCLISKNGGAFGNLAGTVTEIGATGVYQVVLDAGDVDTLGTAIIKFVDAAARDVWVTLQVVALDLNVATVNPGAGGITAASFAAGAIDAAAIAADAIGSSELAAAAVAEIQAGLATGAQVLASRTQITTAYNMGTLDADGSTTGISLMHAISAVVTLTGTWDGATVTVEECADPLAAVPVWTAYASGAKTDDGQVSITGPVAGLRCTMTNDGATSEVACTITITS